MPNPMDIYGQMSGYVNPNPTPIMQGPGGMVGGQPTPIMQGPGGMVGGQPIPTNQLPPGSTNPGKPPGYENYERLCSGRFLPHEMQNPEMAMQMQMQACAQLQQMQQQQGLMMPPQNSGRMQWNPQSGQDPGWGEGAGMFRTRSRGRY